MLYAPRVLQAIVFLATHDVVLPVRTGERPGVQSRVVSHAHAWLQGTLEMSLFLGSVL